MPSLNRQTRFWAIIACVFLHLNIAEGFRNIDILERNMGWSSSSTRLYNVAANALIRKAKLKEVEKLKEDISQEGSAHYINKFLENKEFKDEYGGPIPFLESVQNRHKSVTVMPEYSKKVKTGFITGMPEPEIMGVIYRDAGTR